jgi:nucleotide-binding universal stress UspA family protein
MYSESPIRKILLYVDASEACIAAAQYAIALAKYTQAELKTLYVVNVSLLDELVQARIFVKMEGMDYQQDLEQDGKRYLNYIAEMAKQKGVDVTVELTKGVVNKEVVTKVKEWGIDLLIMGELEPVLSRTETYHDESELIFRKVPCSVLIVKDSEHAEDLYNYIEE